MSSKLLNYPAASSNPHLAAGTSGSTAAARNGTTSHGTAQLNFENLQLDDILCTVCQSVLVEPVFLPCQHRFCRNCLSGTIEKNNLNCPCCRKRFGTWYRNASRVNKLVHEQLWNAIQSQFRDYLEEDGAGGRCNGNGSTGSCFVPQSENVIHLSEPGEIRKEYESELQRYRKELIEEKKKELAASEKYIINLYKQEGIIDLVDSSDHLSISSTTSTPEPEKQREPTQQASSTTRIYDIQEVVDDDDDDDDEDEDEDDDNDEGAGPSGSSFSKQPDNNQKGNHLAQQQPNQNSVISSSSNVHPSRPDTTKSQSNGSVISISSTSSASAASSSCISSASSRYSLIKLNTAAKQQSKAQSSIRTGKAATATANASSSGVSKKIITIAELNKSELCVKPTKLHRRTSSQAVDDDDDDGDSLRSELNHFKPIVATTPKSCFSSKAIVRVPSVRPEAGLLPPKTECLSPSKSPFKPIDPTTPRRSAFSVVNFHLFTPPTPLISQTDRSAQKLKPTKSSPTKKKKATASSSGSSSSAPTTVSGTKKSNRPTKKTNGTAASGHTNRRKRKLKFSPQPKGKVKDDNPPQDVSSSNNSGSRVTRQNRNREPSRLKDLIVTDQQRREAMIEQERLDFEFAQRLQKKLNRTRGATMLLFNPLPKETPMVARKRNSAYSLRRKSVAVAPAELMAPPPPPPPRSTTSSTGLAAPSRKRTPPKADTSPKANPPTTIAKKPKLQPTAAAVPKQDDEQSKSEAANSRSTALRRSTRIRS